MSEGPTAIALELAERLHLSSEQYSLALELLHQAIDAPTIPSRAPAALANAYAELAWLYRRSAHENERDTVRELFYAASEVYAARAELATAYALRAWQATQ